MQGHSQCAPSGLAGCSQAACATVYVMQSGYNRAGRVHKRACATVVHALQVLAKTACATGRNDTIGFNPGAGRGAQKQACATVVHMPHQVLSQTGVCHCVCDAIGLQSRAGLGCAQAGVCTVVHALRGARNRRVPLCM
jgi:hypothetical protein